MRLLTSLKSPKVIIMLGPPGSGKGVQSELLAQKLKLPAFSVGDVLRAEVRKQTPEGLTADKIMSYGLNIDGRLLIKILGKRILNSPQGCILDNPARSQKQLEFFLSFLRENKINVWQAFHIRLDRQTSIERVLGRKHKASDDNRQDDSDTKLIEKRFDDGYDKDILPILKTFRQMKILKEINGNKSKDKIHQEIMKALGKT